MTVKRQTWEYYFYNKSQLTSVSNLDCELPTSWWRHGLFMYGIEPPHPIENLTKVAPSKRQLKLKMVFGYNMYSYVLNNIQGVWKLFHCSSWLYTGLRTISVNLRCFVPAKRPWSLALNNKILMNVLIVTSSWSRSTVIGLFFEHLSWNL